MGFSFLICVGTWGGFHFTKSSSAINICIGFIAFTFFFYDVQDALVRCLNMTQLTEKMPDEKHKKLKSQFLLKGKYIIDGVEGKEIYLVSNLDPIVPTSKGLFFQHPNGFYPTHWRLLN